MRRTLWGLFAATFPTDKKLEGFSKVFVAGADEEQVAATYNKRARKNTPVVEEPVVEEPEAEPVVEE